ncbi:LytR/AlgR family response regulator transcription factor [Flavobacterium gawalongense]|uniref:Response regulator transcription factor n=1 Tax=Flavobacterium gawalongense TaxID=2594432 RepID=A0A553BCT9_9FLAO|nr:LytTR family DNA-binding domain-containing protein [Flavobacterium gawalongense]TRW98563.1 response regulator transcription factor [Flavobacterium gawalongense]TRX03084.1 response regulator transcription factor [Flavobacterium gawalongense]TRX06048.1 response regulator transcription factor [Flavobacterium gawalongense]TRX10976.1 response regulator transcription factor [Flavobacterium gawalongense]TRX22604.1 response regulator transcription factor [Flavobacterium gawalongense]
MTVRKCIIVDDEPVAHYVLVNYISQNPQLELVKQCYNSIEALNYLRSNVVDLMFLDIDMPEITGLELLRTLNEPPKTILTTAYSEFALESYEFGVFDYLLKPIYFPRFLKSIERFFSSYTDEKPKINNQIIAVKIDGFMLDLNVNDILFAQSYGNYVKIFTLKKIYLASMTTNELENSLSSEYFMRVHKSYIVAIDKIKNWERNTVIINNEKIPVGITYRRALTERLKFNNNQ